MNTAIKIEEMPVPSIMMSLAPSVEALSLEGIRSYNFPCVKCGFQNSLSIIPVDGVCKCRICNHEYNINEISEVAEHGLGNSRLMFSDMEGLGTPAERMRRQWMMIMMGVVVIGLAMFMVHYVMKNRRNKE